MPDENPIDPAIQPSGPLTRRAVDDLVSTILCR